MKRLSVGPFVGSMVMVVVAACAHDVPQDAQTGRDGRIKGAVPIKLDNGEGVAKGIVTYPGGDRVDWRSIELPKDSTGTLALEMTYTTPRPGLHVSFDLFDAWNQPITLERAVARSRSAKVDHARGTYFVRVFAPRRGDAGTYKLKASFQQDPPSTAPQQVVVMEPPRLPAVPAVVEECDVFDAKNPDCSGKCPDDAPKTWKGCRTAVCRTPDVNDPTCLAVMKCPAIPDPRVSDCMTGDVSKKWPPCNQAAFDVTNPRCKPEPIAADIIKIEEHGTDEYEITISAGSNQRVEKSWRVQLLSGNTINPLVGGQATITHVEKTIVRARIHAKRSVIEANQHLRLIPN